MDFEASVVMPVSVTPTPYQIVILASKLSLVCAKVKQLVTTATTKQQFLRKRISVNVTPSYCRFVLHQSDAAASDGRGARGFKIRGIAKIKTAVLLQSSAGVHFTQPELVPENFMHWQFKHAHKKLSASPELLELRCDRAKPGWYISWLLTSEAQSTPSSDTGKSNISLERPRSEILTILGFALQTAVT